MKVLSASGKVGEIVVTFTHEMTDVINIADIEGRQALLNEQLELVIAMMGHSFHCEPRAVQGLLQILGKREKKSKR